MDAATRTMLAQLADEAYGAALTTSDPEERGYAAGVEALARHLLGRGTATELAALLRDVQFTARVRADMPSRQKEIA